MMRQPKLKDLKANRNETNRIRKGMSKSSNVKITVNIDAETLSELRSISEETGVPYQRLMNRLLKESLDRKGETQTRLDRLEKEVKVLKKKLAA